MNYMDIKYPDITNGIGVRVTLFVSGCNIHCPKCFNPDSWDPQAGKLFYNETLDSIKCYLRMDQVNGLTIMGGEPFFPFNQPSILNIVEIIKSEFPDKTIWIYSGNTYEDLIEKSMPKKILGYCDVLVDGPYIHDLRDPMLKFRGSSNQRIIDLNKSTKDEVVLLEGL